MQLTRHRETTTLTEISNSLFESNCELTYLLARMQSTPLTAEITARLRSLIEAVGQLQRDIDVELNRN
jgi:hypothetical protein